MYLAELDLHLVHNPHSLHIIHDLHKNKPKHLNKKNGHSSGLQ